MSTRATGAGGADGLSAAMLDAAVDCVVVMDADGLVRQWNAAAERTFGYRREEALGREVAELIVPPSLRERHRAGLQRYLETGEQVILDRHVEMVAMHADGRRFPVDLAVSAAPGVRPPQFVAIVQDVAERRSAEDARGHLAAIVQATDDAIESLDLDGVVLSWNPAAERMYGYRADEVLGRNISIIVPDELRGELDDLLARLRRGEAVEDFETERQRADGARILVSLTLSPISDPVRGVTGISVAARDVTARKRSEAANELLAAASAALDASLDPATTLRTIAETAVPALAELCVIDLLHEDGTIGAPVVAAIDPEVARGLEDIRRRYPLELEGDHPVAEVLRTRRPVAIRDLEEPGVVAQVAQSDEHRGFMREAGYRSAAVVPMLARGRTLGAISLLHVRTERRYDPADLSLLMDLAARAALAFDNARLYAERSLVARTLQRSLLPAALPEIEGLDLAAAYLPAGEGNEVGGDFYDVFEAGSGWGLVVGDVCGKGAAAAALTSLVRYGLRAPALEHESPGRTLAVVNETMLREDPAGRFATVVLARLNLEARPVRATVASAGHPPAIVLPAQGPPRSAGQSGTLLGVGPDVTIPDTRLELAAGDLLLLYTDGVLEAGAPRRVLGDGELAERLASAPERDAETVVRRTVDLALELGEGTLRDDLAVLAARVL